MDASVYVRQPNSIDFAKLGTKKFLSLPRVDEFMSAKYEGSQKYFQVIAVHHAVETEGAVEIYAVETKPPWEVKKGRAIGFGS